MPLLFVVSPLVCQVTRFPITPAIELIDKRFHISSSNIKFLVNHKQNKTKHNKTKQNKAQHNKTQQNKMQQNKNQN